LEAAREVEEERRRGRPAKRRGEGKEADAGDEDALAPEPIPEVPGVQDRRCEQEGVRVDHPLEVGERRVEVTLDARERDIDDRDVQQEHEDGHTHDEKGPPLALHSLEST
jgi:hypothetical protein